MGKKEGKVDENVRISRSRARTAVAPCGLLEVMPALCNPDFTAMELIHARLVRTTTCANGCKCDYTVCGDRDEAFLSAHPEYRDEAGYRRNR